MFVNMASAQREQLRPDVDNSERCKSIMWIYFTTEKIAGEIFRRC